MIKKTFIHTFVLIIIIFQIFCGWSSKEKKDIEYIKKEGQVIVDAIYKYKSDMGHYPKSYKLLIPKYLQNIPDLPDHKYGWIYYCYDNHFTIAGPFHGGGSCKVVYSSEDGNWSANCAF